MLERFPLEPIEWVPPGFVDEYVKNVVEKEENDKIKHAKEKKYYEESKAERQRQREEELKKQTA